MHVEHLMRDETLGLRLLWAEDTLLEREISGVTVTDLEDPARFVRPGEVVLSGLVWWTPEEGQARAERFVAGLRGADAAVLLAGEETHGEVPDDLIEACVRHGIPVAAVPAHVMFRAVTDTVYFQQWRELSRRHALPENARARLSRLAAQDAGPEAILAAAFAHLGRAAVAHVLSATGRTVAATEGTPALSPSDALAVLADGSGLTVPVDADAATTPYERWHLYLPDPDIAPPRMLHEVAAILGRCQSAQARRRAADRQAADELGALLVRAGTEDTAVASALRACGLPSGEGPFRVIAADTGADREGLAEGALAEAVAHVGGPAAVGRLPDGTAFAVLPGDPALAEVWPLVAGGESTVRLHGGTGAPAAGPGDLAGALAEARYALVSARGTAPDASLLTDVAGLTSLDALLSGVPVEVRTAYSRTVLGPLLDAGSATAAPLLDTLRTFLACDGSWARTAQALHLHVNTVHYRIQRVEHFTGRDLSRLTDRLDLWTALLCRG
ncbi:helix-turn-helix domain-containing protein [Streptomyces sp. SID13726]|uniref:PucR family transcriptional regulator n=1 Tax=Streptomyces sp. SID13726 TaxID=2706058 RepID=UPI0013BE49FE|nr:helix-turn-helix domain-containing protein [Streptomyces sp. SID13726]NEA99085.1 PucR family transcriptional regulator [Streptomyces sp. SID13726]